MRNKRENFFLVLLNRNGNYILNDSLNNKTLAERILRSPNFPSMVILVIEHSADAVEAGTVISPALFARAGPCHHAGVLF